MRLTSLKLTNFRNYKNLELSFDEGIHVFYGDNAQGKTNLLEAIFLCTCARSHRTGRDEELIYHGADFYRSEVSFLTDRDLAEKVSFSYIVPDQAHAARPLRKMFYNDIEVSHISDMVGLFHAVIFAPEDLQIIKSGPGVRRRFLDLLISQISRPYFRALQKYNSVLTQRNSLLKIIRDRGNRKSSDAGRAGGSSDDLRDMSGIKDPSAEKDPLELPAMSLQDELAVWDHALAAEAGFILKMRLDCQLKIAKYAGMSLSFISDSKEDLSLRYRSISGISAEDSQEEITAKFYNRLQKLAADDVFRGSTSIGPHRDDLEIYLNGYPARTYASQGQHRSLVLALKIAELLLLEELTGEKPILLLDDVMSELDSKRRSQLLEIVREHQVFLTGTDRGQMFENYEVSRSAAAGEVPEKMIKYYFVRAGTVQADQ